jgi:prevent-host-death family protein
MVTTPKTSKRRTSLARESRPTFGVPPPSTRSREIPAGQFKARCLALMNEVQRSGGEYIITKRGVPVARLLPASAERRPLLGSLKGTASTVGDIVSPLGEPWRALEGWDGED